MPSIILEVDSFKPDLTNMPQYQEFNRRPVYWFDQTTEEYLYRVFRFPTAYASGLTAIVQYSMLSAITGSVQINASVMAVTPGDPAIMTADSYDTVNTSAADTVPGTLGYMKEISFALSNADSLVGGDYFALKLSRNVVGSASGDLGIWSVSLDYV